MSRISSQLVMHDMNTQLANDVRRSRSTPSPWAGRVVTVIAIVAAVVVAHAWAAYVRAREAGMSLQLGIDWDSVWLWSGMVAFGCLACGAVLAWQARHDQARLEAQFLRDGAP